jgi:hypothetical protein
MRHAFAVMRAHLLRETLLQLVEGGTQCRIFGGMLGGKRLVSGIAQRASVGRLTRHCDTSSIGRAGTAAPSSNLDHNPVPTNRHVVRPTA